MSIKIDESNLKSGLLSLVVALVEVINEVLNREALRRMESRQLKEEEIERLGRGLMELDQALDEIKDEHQLRDTVDKLRFELDRTIDDALSLIVNPEVGSELQA